MPPEPRSTPRNRAGATPAPRARAATPRTTPGTSDASGKRRRHQDLLESAMAHAKASHWIECARAAGEALRLANAAGDYESAGAAAERALEARKRIRQAALRIKSVTLAGSLSELGVKVNEAGVARCEGLKNGCYLLEPPGCVGIDGRTLRALCEDAGKSALTLVREPETRSGQWPIVAIGPVTVRAKVAPPKKGEPTPDWCAAAFEALEAAALESVEGDTARERVASLVEHAEAAPECEGLYEALIEETAAAAKEAAEAPLRGMKGKKKPAADEESDEDD